MEVCYYGRIDSFACYLLVVVGWEGERWRWSARVMWRT